MTCHCCDKPAAPPLSPRGWCERCERLFDQVMSQVRARELLGVKHETKD